MEQYVKNEWGAEQRAAARLKAFETMKARYEIILPKEWVQGVTVAGGAPAGKAP